MNFVDSFFNGVESKVKVKHLGKIFEGRSNCLPEDMDKASSFAGCHFAELKAEIKALKYELKIAKASCDECRNFVKACTQYKNFDPESPTAKVMFRQLNRRIKTVNNIVDRIDSAQYNLEKEIRQRDLITSALDRQKAKNG